MTRGEVPGVEGGVTALRTQEERVQGRRTSRKKAEGNSSVFCIRTLEKLHVRPRGQSQGRKKTLDFSHTSLLTMLDDQRARGGGSELDRQKGTKPSY